MTPQENAMLATLLDRLERLPQGVRDADAEAMVDRAAVLRPDLAYLLAQTVLVQELALKQAKDRQAAAESSRFSRDEPQTGLAGLFGELLGRSVGRRDPSASPAPASPTAPSTDRVTAPGSSFLANAAATAAGVTGGALLLQGIQSILGAGPAAKLPQHPGLTEAARVEPVAQRQRIEDAAAADNGVSSDEEFI
jgi:hypothetical protein